MESTNCESKPSELMPSEELIYELADFFKLFGDSTRLRILWALDSGELCVNELSANLGLSVSAISHQLGALRTSRLVKLRREGKNSYYSLDDSHVKLILETALAHIGHTMGEVENI